MADKDTSSLEKTAEAPLQAVPAEKKRLLWMAVVSLLLTVAAWIACGYNVWAAIALSAVAVVVGALSLKSHRHAVRNTAITSIIAASVLLVVVVSFLIVIYLGLSSI